MRVVCAHSAHGIIMILHNTIGKVGKEIILLGDVLMATTMNLEMEKREYFVPVIELYTFNQLDVLCMSNDEEYDNEFDAGEMGNF